MAKLQLRDGQSTTGHRTLRDHPLQVTVYYDIGGVQPEQAQSAKADLGGAAAIDAFQNLLQQAGAPRTGSSMHTLHC